MRERIGCRDDFRRPLFKDVVQARRHAIKLFELKLISFEELKMKMAFSSLMVEVIRTSTDLSDAHRGIAELRALL